MDVDHLKLSKIISHALRHNPANYGLTLDSEGWTEVDMLLSAIHMIPQWSNLTRADLEYTINKYDKKRHQISGDRIRALYGHSIPNKILRIASRPPDYLYHGTITKKIQGILTHGLLPMKRQYVHLSINIAEAEKIALRRKKETRVIMVNSGEAYLNEIKFYREDTIWLADFIPSKFLKVL